MANIIINLDSMENDCFDAAFGLYWRWEAKQSDSRLRKKEHAGYFFKDDEMVNNSFATAITHKPVAYKLRVHHLISAPKEKFE